MTRSTTAVQNLHITDTRLGTAFEAISLFSGATEAQRMIMSLWAAHTWIYRMFPATPRLSLCANEPGAGKTANMQVTLALCSKPELFGYTSQASVYSWLDEHPDTTFGLDEIDKAFGEQGRAGGRNILASVVNDGYTSKGAVMVNRGGKAVKVPVFAPIATAGLGRLPEDTLTRAIPIHLHKTRPAEVYVDTLHDDSLNIIGEDLGTWLRSGPAQDFIMAEPKMSELGDISGDPRFLLITAPLAAIAKYAGCHDQFVAAIREIVTGIQARPPRARHEMLLEDLRSAWSDENQKIMTTSEIISRLRDHDSKRWTKLANNRLGEVEVASLLRQNGVESKTSNGIRGYGFGDVFAGTEVADTLEA